jgi:ATP-dependent helicase HrpA
MDTAAQLEKLLSNMQGIMQSDTAWCRRRIVDAQRRLKRGQPVDRILAGIVERGTHSAEKVRRRDEHKPTPKYDPALPITASHEDILAAIKSHQVVIVAGETGSGKTTQLPKICLDAGRGLRGHIGCTQPRRIAARAMAERVSEELGTVTGKDVGYQVRFRDKSHPDGYIKFMTDGILLAETAHDPYLNAYDTLIIDEAHERSLNIDFLLGYLHQLLPKRPDLKLIVTSATIDTQKFSAHFANAPVIEVSGRGFPVELVYQPLDEDQDGDRQNRNLYKGIADAVTRLNRVDPAGDILVFLSGEREIHEATDYLTRQHFRHTEILPLYARLSAGEQRRVFHPGAARRIILSTNVAETSLTVPRIRFVIDSGFARISRYAHRSRIQRLPVEPVSQASANQRSGRCGRLGPGTCVRLYDEQDFNLRPEYTEPEILRTSLASVILKMLTMGLGEVEVFPFLDPPAPRMINDAYHLLYELQAIDEQRQPVKLGRSLSRWPLDVRLARMVIEGDRQGCLEDMLVLTAVLSIQDPRERPLEVREAADEAHARFTVKKSDFAGLLKLWAYLRKARKKYTGNQFRKLCRREFLNWQRVLEWFDLVQQLRDQAREDGMALSGRHGDDASVHRALLSGLLSLVGQKDPEGHGYAGPRGRQFHIFPGSGLFGNAPPWLMSAEVVETTKPYARTNAAIDPVWIETQARHLLRRHHSDPHWSRKRGSVMAWQQVTLYGLVLADRRLVNYASIDPQEARQIFILSGLVRGELDTRAAFMQHNRDLLAEVETLEHKRRSRDVIVDENVQVDFFDARLPANVCSAKTFHDWLKKLGKEGRKQLLLSHDVLTLSEAGDAPVTLYPDHLEINARQLPLTYRFEPGHAEDGVTLTVPLEWLNQLDAGKLQWLIPGMLRDKLVELIRSLPKPLRRAFTPPREFAAAAAGRFGKQGALSLLHAFAMELKALTGVEVSAGDFNEAALDDHLRMFLKVVDEAGKTLACGRDVEVLKAQFGEQARRRFMDQQGHAFNRDGEKNWSFGALPQQVETDHGGLAWPALVDQVDAVGVRLFDSHHEAAAAHHEGVVRLLALKLVPKLNWLHRHHGLGHSGLLAWSALGSPDRLIRDAVQASLEECAGDGTTTVRDEAGFDTCLGRVRSQIGSVFQQMVTNIDATLDAWSAVSSLLDDKFDRQRPSASADLRAQLDDLVYEGFLLDLESGRLAHYPRYLSGIKIRIEQLQQNPSRDAQRMDMVAPYWRRYLEWLDNEGNYDQALDSYRWLLEEYRVSLFAQQLGTVEKVSPKRLDAAWEQVVANES